MIIDGCDANNLGLYSHKSLDDFQETYFDAEIIDTELAIQILEDSNRTPVTETIKEKYEYALEVLPPENWKNIPDGDYFQMSEYWSGNITTYYVRQGDRYFTFMDNAWMTPKQVMEKLNENR